MKPSPQSRYLAEVKLVSLREEAPPDALLDNPRACYDYWMTHVATGQSYRPEQEQVVVYFLNGRYKILGHQVVTIGIANEVMCHPREVFRAAIVQNAVAIIMAHNHPSGECVPSEADIRMTKKVIEAGKLLMINVLDHIIVGDSSNGARTPYASLREMGFFNL